MKHLGILLFYLGANCVINFTDGHVDYNGQKVLRAIPRSMDEVQILRQMGQSLHLDFWTDPHTENVPVDFRVKPAQINDVENQLKLNNIFYKVHISDIQSLIDREISSRETGRNSARALAATSVETFVYSEYHPAEEVYEWMDLVTLQFNFATKEQIGLTYQGRPIYVIKFEKPSTSSKPTIFVDALIHCREWVTTASLMFIFKEMLTNPAYVHMMDEVDWYFVPMINVDGYVETWTGDRLWRKTRSSGPSSLCTGVDANRNFDSYWSSPGASGDPCSYTYYGPMAESESEVRHLSNYVLGLGKGKLDAYVTTHSYSQLILYPYGYSKEPCADDAELNATSKMIHDAIKAVHGKYYAYGPSSTTIYVTSGTTTDWTYDKAGVVHSYTFELRDTGEYGFLLPADQIIPNGEEYLAGLEILSNYVRDNYEGSGM